MSAAGYAHYRGDVTSAIERDIATARPFGPNYMGEVMFAVSAEYDAATDRTRVGFDLRPASSEAVSA